jgi:hypothetical protein
MILYKYMSNSSYTVDCLEKNYLYCATPAELNDPFELWFVHSIHKSTWEQIKEYIRHQAKKHNRPIEEFKKIYKKMGKDEFLNDIKENYVELNGKVRIVCLTKNYNSLLMWSHYANHHKGILVKVEFTGADAVYNVKYSLETPTFNPILRTLRNNFENVFLTKHVDWEYEKESRLIVRDGTMLRLSKNAISEVVFGVRCEPSFKQKVETVLSGKNVFYKSARKVEGKYSLEYLPK